MNHDIGFHWCLQNDSCVSNAFLPSWGFLMMAVPVHVLSHIALVKMTHWPSSWHLLIYFSKYKCQNKWPHRIMVSTSHFLWLNAGSIPTGVAMKIMMKTNIDFESINGRVAYAEVCKTSETWCESSLMVQFMERWQNWQMRLSWKQETERSWGIETLSLRQFPIILAPGRNSH